ncbi:hypothetical protein DFJ74DRAFT_745624 [Hyaloraphidium curvatum]|nr:hypothetical protein DFJ74DRAFT_745624 [Hyaloraphidium curvatum]
MASAAYSELQVDADAPKRPPPWHAGLLARLNTKAAAAAIGAVVIIGAMYATAAPSRDALTAPMSAATATGAPGPPGPPGPGSELAFLCRGVPPPAPKEGANSSARPDLQQGFETIYSDKQWDGGAGGGSGAGSEIGFTQFTRLLIESFIYKHHVRRFLDAPCGASYWWPPLLPQIRSAIPCFEYRGMDIVREVVKNNSRRYEDDPLTSFAVMDVTVGPLPRGYDVILSRDAMQHLPVSAVINAIEQYSKAEPRYLLIGSYLKSGSNYHFEEGVFMPGWPINVMLPPFLMAEPIEILDERNGGKYLLAYTGEQLKKLDFAKIRNEWNKMKHSGRRKA